VRDPLLLAVGSLTTVPVPAPRRVDPCVAGRAMLAAPAGSAPTTVVDGLCSASQVSAPAISPPPPTGTTRVPRPRPWSASCSTTSRASVPCPAIVRGSSKAGTGVAPDSRANAALAAAASS